MQTYPAEWLYPDETQAVNSLSTACQQPAKQDVDSDKTGPKQVTGIVFTLEDLLREAGVKAQSLRTGWLPYLEQVAPGGIRLGKGRYTRKALELVISLRVAKNDGKSPEEWVLLNSPPPIDIDREVEAAQENGAIVPVEVLDAVATGASQIVQAQQQASLALSLVDAVLTGIHDQQQAYSAQTQAFDIERIRAQAAIKYAVELQVEAQVRAEMDAKIAANKQAAIEAQLQRFQGGER